VVDMRKRRVTITAFMTGNDIFDDLDWTGPTVSMVFDIKAQDIIHVALDRDDARQWAWNNGCKVIDVRDVFDYDEVTHKWTLKS
jgi:hypothetical protein